MLSLVHHQSKKARQLPQVRDKVSQHKASLSCLSQATMREIMLQEGNHQFEEGQVCTTTLIQTRQGHAWREGGKSPSMHYVCHSPRGTNLIPPERRTIKNSRQKAFLRAVLSFIMVPLKRFTSFHKISAAQISN